MIQEYRIQERSQKLFFYLLGDSEYFEFFILSIFVSLSRIGSSALPNNIGDRMISLTQTGVSGF